jgi:hypothetical protein
MRKTFIIKNSSFKAISHDKGAIDFFLVDESGEKRTVSAVANLGRNKKIKSVTAVHKRETPLINALVKSSIKDTIEVDFTGFNNLHPRVVSDYKRKVGKRVANTVPQSENTVAFSLTKPQLIFMGFSIVALIIIVM